MLVVSDTSPLNYLILTDAIGILPMLYTRVAIPHAVALEFNALHTPEKVKRWFANPPMWLEIHPVSNPPVYPDLDRGETEAIALAKILHADLLLIDERRATHIAREQEKLVTTGILGVLLDAALLGLIELPAILSRLEQETTFRAPARLYREILDQFLIRSAKK